MIYIVIPDLQTFYLLDVYDKDEADDLTSSEKRELRALAEDLIKELRDRAKRERR